MNNRLALVLEIHPHPGYCVPGRDGGHHLAHDEAIR